MKEGHYDAPSGGMVLTLMNSASAFSFMVRKRVTRKSAFYLTSHVRYILLIWYLLSQENMH